MKHFITLLLSSLIILIAPQTFAQSSDDWVMISDKVVNYKSETDTVEPLAYVSQRNFSKLKIKVVQGTVNLKNVVVTMSDGSSKELQSMGTLTKGMSTRVWRHPNSERAQYFSAKHLHRSAIQLPNTHDSRFYYRTTSTELSCCGRVIKLLGQWGLHCKKLYCKDNANSTV